MAEKADEKSKAARATVARGRTVHVPTDKREIAGSDKDNKPVHRAVVKVFGPGQELELPADEVRALRKSGHLVDPDAIAPATGEGPNFQEQGRPTQAA